MGKEDVFFNMLEASAEEARTSVQALVRALQNPNELKNLDEFILSRRKDKAITARINEALCSTFVTALEREDIEALSTALYRIPKTVEKIAERLMLAPQFLNGVEIGAEISLLQRGSDTLLQMIRELRRGVHLERIKSLNDQLQIVEGDADKVLLELLRKLYTTERDALRVVFLKELFELMEKVVDRCRDAGNVVNHIVLKNS